MKNIRKLNAEYHDFTFAFISVILEMKAEIKF